VMKHYDVLRDELLKTGVVEEVAASESAITSTFTTNSGFTWYGKDPNRTEEFVTTGVTHEFGKTIGWKIKAGRDFSRDIASDSSGFIINESAAKYLGMKEPLGETVKWGDNGEWKIIGIVEDMVTQSPYNSVKPMLFFLESNRIAWVQFNQVNMKLRADANAGEALNKITPVFKKYDAENAVEYMFADQEFGKKFDDEKRIGDLAMVSTVLAIFISCLGLFGLASFVASQRTKEIGIRKILGASVPQLWKLLSKDFVMLVVVSCIVSVPFSLYFMTDWLLQYEYRITISWQIYAVAWVGAIAVTLLTISFQSLKTALGNPVRALRSE
jgi:putative ABC transport system permease protein